MTRREVFGAFAGAASAFPFTGQAGAGRKPNIVLFLADDLGVGDVRCYFSERALTPNIDSLAANGVKFTDGYVSAAVCSPSRAGLLTGRYQQRFGHEFNNGPPKRDLEERLGLPATEVILPKLLQSAGYRTGMVGKWHLGSAPEFHPIDRGFDEFFGFLPGANGYVTSKTPNSFWASTSDTPVVPLRPQRNFPVLRGKEVVDEDEYLTDAFAREAAAFVDRHKERPFFLYVPFNAVHTPLHVIQRYLDRFADVTDVKRRTLLAMTSAMDDAVGAVVRKVRDIGQEDNTIFIFLSDNGCPTYTQAGSNGPLNGSKITYYEGGIRVPFLMQWKARLKGGAVYKDPVISLDLFPTILNAAGAQAPKDRSIDGVDLVPFITGKNRGQPHPTIFWRARPAHAVRKGPWKLIEVGDSHRRLYNLESDLGEKRDLAGANPKMVKELQEAYTQWDATMVSPRWEPRGSVVVPVNGNEIRWSV